MKKTFIYFITIFTLLLPLYCNAEDISFVKDEATLLKQETTDYINVYSNYLKDNFKIDYYVTTINNLESLTIEEYTDNFYTTNNLSNNSLLIVISKEDRQIRVKTGSDLSELINNTIIDNYLKDYFIPYMKTNKWDEGIKNGYSAFFKLICDYYEIDSEIIEVNNGNDFISQNKSYIILFITWITSIFSYIYASCLKNKDKITIKDKFIVAFTIILNILVLIISYYIMPISIIVVLLAETIFIYSELFIHKPRKRKQTKEIIKEKEKKVKIKQNIRNTKNK